VNVERVPASCRNVPRCALPCDLCLDEAREKEQAVRVVDRRALPEDGPDIGWDVPGGGAI
jgi:hypothetical protein